MLNGWNRKVRITRAIKSAWMTTRMVSPKPLSVFVPDVTLIAFPIPVAIDARWQSIFLTRIALVSRQENGLDSDIVSQFRPELAPFRYPCGVLDGCSQPRNQRSHENLLIH